MPADRFKAKAYSYIPSLSSHSPRSSPLFVRMRIGSGEGEGGEEKRRKACKKSVYSPNSNRMRRSGNRREKCG